MLRKGSAIVKDNVFHSRMETVKFLKLSNQNYEVQNLLKFEIVKRVNEHKENYIKRIKLLI